MNADRLHAAVQGAIQRANQVDAESSRVRDSIDYRANDARMRAFLAFFAGRVERECPEVTGLIMDFLNQVNWDTNPMLDVAGVSEEKPE